MPSENEVYRIELEGLLEHFGPNKNILTCKEVAKYCGVGHDTAKRRFGIGSSGIPIRTFALKLSKM